MKSSTVKLLDHADRVCKAIDEAVDWFILYIGETDPDMKAFYMAMSKKKDREMKVIAREAYE